MSLSTMISNLKSKELAAREERKNAYAKGYEVLKGIKTELETAAKGTGIVVEELEYKGLDGWPSQNYLRVYKPYAVDGFKILVNSSGCVTLESPNHEKSFGDSESERKLANLHIARAWVSSFGVK